MHIPSPLVKGSISLRSPKMVWRAGCTVYICPVLNVAILNKSHFFFLFLLGYFNWLIEDGWLTFDSQCTNHGSKLGIAITGGLPPLPNLIVLIFKLAHKRWFITCPLQQTGVHHQDRLLVCPSRGALKAYPCGP